jgi:hypothetical protein
MQVVCIKKNNFEEWTSNNMNLYIGRNMSFYVKGTNASKWMNPFTVKKYGLDKSLKLYEDHIRKSELYNMIEEIEGKTLGCWCESNKCHGNILIKLLNEKKNRKCIICRNLHVLYKTNFCGDCENKYRYNPKKDNIADNYKFPELKVTQEDIDKVNAMI